MNLFDQYIMTSLNAFANKSKAVDLAFHSLAGNNLLKGGLIVSILWALWFTRDEAREGEVRKIIIATFLGTFMGLFLTRVLANVLPFCPRPIHNMEINFMFPYGVVKETLDNASSFPSDHAVMFIGLATGIFMISRLLGYLIIGYCCLFILLARVYLGYHYPTDIIAGAFIGIVFVFLANSNPIRKHLVDKIYNFSLEYPRMFYGLLFFISYQSADLFDDSRILAIKGLKFLHLLG